MKLSLNWKVVNNLVEHLQCEKLSMQLWSRSSSIPKKAKKVAARRNGSANLERVVCFVAWRQDEQWIVCEWNQGPGPTDASTLLIPLRKRFYARPRNFWKCRHWLPWKNSNLFLVFLSEFLEHSHFIVYT